MSLGLDGSLTAIAQPVTFRDVRYPTALLVQRHFAAMTVAQKDRVPAICMRHHEDAKFQHTCTFQLH